MFAKDWHVTQCMESFQDFALPIFSSSAERSRNIFGTLVTAVRCLLNGELCASEAAKASFQTSFGMSSTLSSHPSGGVSRVKYGVTATEVNKAATIVFSNYTLPKSYQLTLVPKEHPEGESSKGLQIFPSTTNRHITGNVRLWEA